MHAYTCKYIRACIKTHIPTKIDMILSVLYVKGTSTAARAMVILAVDKIFRNCANY